MVDVSDRMKEKEFRLQDPKMKTCENLLRQQREEVNRMILKEFGKSECDIQQYLGILKDWMKTQHHLPESLTDAQLLQFLNLNKYSVEKSKQKIDMYYTVRTLIPDFFRGTNPNSPQMRRQSEMIYFLPLPKLAPNLCRVIYCRFNEICTVDQTNVELFFAHGFNGIEILMQEDFAMGLILVIDCNFFKAGHIPKINIMTIKKGAFVMEKVYSNRIKDIYFINAQPYVDVLITMIKSVLPKKIAKRVHVDRTEENLFKCLPNEMFPQDIGGNEVSLKTLNGLWQEKFASFKDHFDKLETLKVNEALRPSPLVNDEILGYHGNFKKLNLD